jgi:ferrous iron transport protein B
MATTEAPTASRILESAERLRRGLDVSFRDQIVEAIYSDAHTIADGAVRRGVPGGPTWDAKIDRIVTSRLWGFPIMLALLAGVLWVTIIGANYPSQAIAFVLFRVEDLAAGLFDSLGVPWWITGFVWHGVWRGLAWVIAVMLPPMAIFFPLFTILENLGYLPRVAFNMDWLFKRVGAHGKQALTMSMGFGCNAAGLIACRVIDSPRERLIAILTNNFVPCNGRFPTLIFFTLVISWLLSRTVLKGQASSFTLELPPYRRPNIPQILYTSIIDRTLFVLWRAVLMAAPAGGLIWLMSNLSVGGDSLTGWVSAYLDPLGQAIGLDGVILLAYIIAIPANEIVVPTILMAYMGSGMMIEIDSLAELQGLLVGQQGWTLLTAVCLMLFSLLHNPCSTTIWTMYKETGSVKWTSLGALMPLAIAFAVCFAVAQAARFLL